VLGEKPTSSSILGVLLIISSLVVIFGEKWKKTEIDKGQYFALFATILTGFAVVIDGLILKEFSVAFYLVISSLFAGMGTLVFDPKLIYDISPFKNKKIFVPIIMAAIMHAFAVFLMYTSYKIGGKMAAVIPITQSAGVIIIFLSVLLLRETKDLWKKILAMALSILGISFLK